MNWKINHERLRKAVDRLLSLAQSSEPPVPIEQITRLRGVQLRCVPYEGSLAGLLLWEGGQPVIGINALHGRLQQRFAIAHELAHIELRHHSGIHIDRDFPFPLHLQQTSSKIDLSEFEASMVAGELLVPSAMLVADLKEKPIDYLDETFIHSLAQRYQVSAHTMLLRLAQGYIHPHV
ncbi:MAG TPA: ImmA/IrrE family metallo-endopeptidase [Ktedonobacteraceae bacterium]|nr:ImmA/IrrE family metallo-endopeptidase [Ktedonobacteraceae bacterium]